MRAQAALGGKEAEMLGRTLMVVLKKGGWCVHTIALFSHVPDIKHLLLREKSHRLLGNVVLNRGVRSAASAVNESKP